MKGYLEDILYCFKLSLYFFIISFVIGGIVGFILHGMDMRQVVTWACRMVQILGTLGLAIAGMSFLKSDLMRPLNYQKEWETYFKKFNLSFVILIISIFIIIISFIIEGIIK